ncbi:MAG: LacI family transcriptional regulator [Lachnospiraceae bacterium]|nr:LacI family transcriptional regulator [Lachnospiraceae bacterium]
METITIKDIARICKVGVTTVSRAMNNHPDINEETKQMIMKVIEEYHYVPNNSARNLKRSDSRTIAVLIKGIDNPFFSSMIGVLEHECQEEHYTFLLHRVEEREDELYVALELEKEKKLRGIIFLGGCFTHSEEELRQLKVPFVICTVQMPEEISKDVYSSVSVDDRLESFRMVDYLCGLGHKRIAIITAWEDDESIGRQRYEGYESALEKHGLSVEPDLVLPMKEGIKTYSMESGYVVVREALERGLSFTALYAVSDTVAFGACRALLEAGKRIPEDVSVCGFDGIEMSEYYHPSLTTMCQPKEEMAREAIGLLFGMIKKKRGNEHMLFSARLMERESTCQVKEKDLLVARKKPEKTTRNL